MCVDFGSLSVGRSRSMEEERKREREGIRPSLFSHKYMDLFSLAVQRAAVEPIFPKLRVGGDMGRARRRGVKSRPLAATTTAFSLTQSVSRLQEPARHHPTTMIDLSKPSGLPPSLSYDFYFLARTFRPSEPLSLIDMPSSWTNSPSAQGTNTHARWVRRKASLELRRGSLLTPRSTHPIPTCTAAPPSSDAAWSFMNLGDDGPPSPARRQALQGLDHTRLIYCTRKALMRVRNGSDPSITLSLRFASRLSLVTLVGGGALACVGVGCLSPDRVDFRWRASRLLLRCRRPPRSIYMDHII